MNDEALLIQNLLSAAESLSHSCERAEEKLERQKTANDRLRSILFTLERVCEEKEREARETEVRVAEKKQSLSEMEMKMEKRRREEKRREVELNAWLKRDDRKFALEREKRKEEEKNTPKLSSLLFRKEEEDEEAAEEKQREEEKQRDEEDEMWSNRAREKVQESLARFRIEFLEREETMMETID
jgi:hypothetical protein